MAPTDTWYKDNFFISTNKSLIQPAAVNEAFANPAIYWVKPIEEALLKKALDNSLCFGVYLMPSSSSDIAGRANPTQIGLARLITDHVSLAYLTDVYILDAYQGKGLGTWLMACVNETLESWPELRRALLISSDGEAFYEKALGMKRFEQKGLVMMNRKFAGSAIPDEM